MTIECPKCGRVALAQDDVERICESVMANCGYRDGQPVVDAIRFSLRNDERTLSYQNTSDWYRSKQNGEAASK